MGKGILGFDSVSSEKLPASQRQGGLYIPSKVKKEPSDDNVSSNDTGSDDSDVKVVRNSSLLGLDKLAEEKREERRKESTKRSRNQYEGESRRSASRGGGGGRRRDESSSSSRDSRSDSKRFTSSSSDHHRKDWDRVGKLESSGRRRNGGGGDNGVRTDGDEARHRRSAGDGGREAPGAPSASAAASISVLPRVKPKVEDVDEDAEYRHGNYEVSFC